MWQRVFVAVIGVPILIYIVLFAPLPVMTAALCILAGIGGWELQRCVSGIKRDFLSGMSIVFPAALVLCHDIWPEYASALFFLESVLIFAYAIYRGGEMKLIRLMSALFGAVFLGYSFAAFLRMAKKLHRAWLLLPFVLSFACDTFAYFAGKAFGRHKLAPKVSPKKTIEGSIGGILGNIICGLLFVWFMAHWLELDGGISYPAMTGLAFLSSIAAQIGDLSFSLIKREFGIKDYGRLFLEHGGVLDRFDSVLFVAPLIELILYLAG